MPGSQKAARVFQRTRRDLWLLRAVALVISILLWITVFGGKKGEITKRVNLDFQMPKGLVISNQAPHEVTFRVSGPRAFLREYQDRPIGIPVDLTGYKAGEYQISLSEDLLDIPLGLRVVSISQTLIPVKLEKVSTKRVPVRAVFSENLPDDVKMASITLRPSTVELKGAQSRLQSLDAIPTEAISLSTSSLKQELDVNLSVGDLPGVFVDDLNRTVHVSVELQGPLSKRWFRHVPVAVHVGLGSELKSYDPKNTGIRVRPESVNFLLEGPDNVLAQLKDEDLDVWAEIPQLKAGTFKAHLDWKLAPELRVVRRSTDSVEIVVPTQIHE